MKRTACALAASALILIAPGTALAKPAPKAVAAHDWTKTFSATESGGVRIGNPKARVAIVEYGSLTCPHCRHFAESAMKPLVSQYVRSGKASYEFRSYILNQVDLAATLVARCGGPAPFFPIAEQLYANQPVWSEKLGNLPDEEQQKIDRLAEPQMMLAIAKVSGLLPIAAAHGISPAKAEACLKDHAAATRLMQDVQAAQAFGITGTPTIFINGKRQAVYDWATLEPFLKGTSG